MKSNVFLGFSFFLILTCEQQKAEFRKDLMEVAKNAPDATIFSFKTENSKLNKKLWILEAKEARRYSKSKTIDLRKLRIKIYKEDRTLASSVTADYGTFYDQSKDFELRTNVVVVSSNGTILRSQYLKWNDRIEELSAPSTYLVKVKRPSGDRHQGMGFRADKSLETIEFLKDAQGEGYFEEDDDL